MSDVQQAVREKYGAIARAVTTASTESGCCGPAACGGGDPITSNLYSDAETSGLPPDALTASLGCGNPTALLALEPGQTVLDLGSGGGIDVLLSATRVGPTGKVYGLDMTDEMLALARENQRKSGATNVEFLRGTIESIPLPDDSVDVIISNCVINLSSDKDAVLREAFRVLKPGGRFAVSDVVVRGNVPAEIRRSMELWVGCVAGALEEAEYESKLLAAGFTNVELEAWRIYKIADARAFLMAGGVDVDRLAPQIEGRFASAFVRARKPEAMDTVIFACVHNAGRSQMASALFNTLADPLRARAISAGTQPAERVHPVVVEVMKELGVDLSSHRPQKLTDELARGASLLITMGCGDDCPVIPGLLGDDWPLADPKDRPLAEVRAIRDDLRQRVGALVEAHRWNRRL